MIPCSRFAEALQRSDIRFVTGVPDSLLKDVCAYLSSAFQKEAHTIATNEGSAIGLAIGHYLATSRPALVYMQNSGLGNAINPLTSLADPEVYGIPMILMIGWRGEITANGSQIHDEPQHKKQGRISPAQLDLLEIPYAILDSSEDIFLTIEQLTRTCLEKQGPVALLVRKGSFEPYELRPEHFSGSTAALNRETAIQTLLDHCDDTWPIIATTGVASRELYELRKNEGQPHSQDFLTVGGMGHASQIATGIARAIPNRKVVCIDGDGALLMHMGALAISSLCSNLIHVLINNGAHDSVGGQPTRAREIKIREIASACGYAIVRQAQTESEISAAISEARTCDGSIFIEIQTRAGFRTSLGRPVESPAENKRGHMDFLRELADGKR